MRRLAVADIHGHAGRFREALRKADYRPGRDRLFLLGDYMDRGPENRASIDLARRLVAEGACALQGNHERMLLQAAEDSQARSAWLHNGGRQTWREFGGFPPDDMLKFLAGLPLYHAEPDCILVHAGLRPGVPLDKQTAHDLTWIRQQFWQGYTGKRVIFGHTPTFLLHGLLEPWHGTDKTGIDTGAWCGGLLTVFDLDSREAWAA